MSNTVSIATSTTWGPERKHLAAVLAGLIGIVWALSFAGPAQARVILDDIRTDIEAVRAQNYRLTAQPQEGMLPQETALREAARVYGEQQLEPPVTSASIEAVRAENFRSEAPVARTEIEAVRAQNFSFDAPAARTDIEAVRAQNFGPETRWGGDYAAALRALSDPSYGHPQPAHDFTPVETHTPEIVDGVDVGLVTAAVTIGLIAAGLLALGINRRRAVSLP